MDKEEDWEEGWAGAGRSSLNLRWAGDTQDTWDGHSWARGVFNWKGEVLGIMDNELLMSFTFHQSLYLNQPKLGKFRTPQRPDHPPLIN